MGTNKQKIISTVTTNLADSSYLGHTFIWASRIEYDDNDDSQHLYRTMYLCNTFKGAED